MLCNPELRRRYDAHGSEGLDVNFMDSGEFFNALFGSDKFDHLVGGWVKAGWVWGELHGHQGVVQCAVWQGHVRPPGEWVGGWLRGWVGGDRSQGGCGCGRAVGGCVLGWVWVRSWVAGQDCWLMMGCAPSRHPPPGPHTPAQPHPPSAHIQIPPSLAALPPSLPQVGELIIAAAARSGGDLTPAQLERLQLAREEKLVVMLGALLRRWVEGDCQGFRVGLVGWCGWVVAWVGCFRGCRVGRWGGGRSMCVQSCVALGEICEGGKCAAVQRGGLGKGGR